MRFDMLKLNVSPHLLFCGKSACVVLRQSFLWPPTEYKYFQPQVAGTGFRCPYLEDIRSCHATLGDRVLS